MASFLNAQIVASEAQPDMLAVRFSPDDAAKVGMSDGRRVQIQLFTLADTYVFRGVIRYSDRGALLLPDDDGSAIGVSQVLRVAGLGAGDEAPCQVFYDGS